MKRLLRIGDLDPAELNDLLGLSQRVKDRPGEYAGALAGRSIGLFFMKQSVRTWVSTDVAAIELGIHPVVIRNEQIGLGSRESPEDVGRVLERYLDLLGMRVFDHDDLERVAKAVSVPVINLLSDAEHPCQAIADLQTMAEHRPLAETTVAYVGDGNNTAASLIGAVTRAGGSVRLASPAGYMLSEEVTADARHYGEVLVTTDPVEAVSGANVVYTDVWTSMGQEAESAERRRAFAHYQVDVDLFERANPDALFMHCLPAHRGEEVTDELLEHPRSVVFDQAENRLHSFKAILLRALS
ncbi:MAG TPA: ornithine carbamoyltransferase [Acidimicrobiia bacterium]|nr:ornithine carbamoyltransferase [Acidimicrobiia bacterium]